MSDLCRCGGRLDVDVEPPPGAGPEKAIETCDKCGRTVQAPRAWTAGHIRTRIALVRARRGSATMPTPTPALPIAPDYIAPAPDRSTPGVLATAADLVGRYGYTPGDSIGGAEVTGFSLPGAIWRASGGTWLAHAAQMIDTVERAEQAATYLCDVLGLVDVEPYRARFDLLDRVEYVPRDLAAPWAVAVLRAAELAAAAAITRGKRLVDALTAPTVRTPAELTS